ncbi:FliI/YscN family ATPase [Frigidibacter sp. MR17.14]|uniref:FliI/YscN family ATPase n=1 Tax=Frigidibacter sp. MR17.14 TaxID=3126509 RepID=UPI003012BA23
MHTAFSGLNSQVRSIQRSRIEGRVSAVGGLALSATGLDRAAGLGDRVRVHGRRGPVEGEVVAIDAARLSILPFGDWDGVAIGDGVEVLGPAVLTPDDSWIGHVLDALGRPYGPQSRFFEGAEPRPVRAAPPPAFGRRRVGARLETGIRALDIFAPICRGQRMGVFAGSGVGKSTLMAMLARQTDAEVIVIGLVGERGRELQDFIEEDLGPEGMARAVVIAATGDESPLMRRQAAWTATAVAEHFRDRGKQVLLMLDSVTRFAMAQREIGLSAGEPPTAKGYPPTVFAELPRLLERAGPGPRGAGDITALFTVLVDGDDHNEPISDAVRGITDGHVVLERRIAERGRYPAVNLQRSLSRMLPGCHSEIDYAIMDAARRAMARYADMEDLIRIGAYRHGSDPETDQALAFAEPAERFLSQRKGEATGSAEAFAALYGLLHAAGVPVELPPAAPPA